MPADPENRGVLSICRQAAAAPSRGRPPASCRLLSGRFCDRCCSTACCWRCPRASLLGGQPANGQLPLGPASAELGACGSLTGGFDTVPDSCIQQTEVKHCLHRPCSMTGRSKKVKQSAVPAVSSLRALQTFTSCQQHDPQHPSRGVARCQLRPSAQHQLHPHDQLAPGTQPGPSHLRAPVPPGPLPDIRLLLLLPPALSQRDPPWVV